MRIAIHIPTTPTQARTILELLPAADVNDCQPVVLTWANGKPGDILCKDFDARRVLWDLGNLFENGAVPSPLKLARAIMENGGCQVVHDGARYRNLSTAKDESDAWTARWDSFGVDVNAEDEKDAQRKVAREVGRLIEDSPEQAARLAAWYKDRKVSKVSSGKLPAAVPIASLAWAGEEALAKQPIKQAPRKERTPKADKKD